MRQRQIDVPDREVKPVFTVVVGGRGGGPRAKRGRSVSLWRSRGERGIEAQDPEPCLARMFEVVPTLELHRQTCAGRCLECSDLDTLARQTGIDFNFRGRYSGSAD